MPYMLSLKINLYNSENSINKGHTEAFCFLFFCAKKNSVLVHYLVVIINTENLYR